MPTDPRRLTLLALLALAPVALFALGRSPVVVLSALSVLVIAWSLYAMLGPSEAPAPAA